MVSGGVFVGPTTRLVFVLVLNYLSIHLMFHCPTTQNAFNFCTMASAVPTPVCGFGVPSG